MIKMVHLDLLRNIVEDKETKKAAKKIIKRFKKHPEWYTQEEVMYAKMLKKRMKLKKKDETAT